MCSLLLEHGAEVDHQAKNGLAALHLAAQEDRVPVAQLLIKNGAQVQYDMLVILIDLIDSLWNFINLLVSLR